MIRLKNFWARASLASLMIALAFASEDLRAAPVSDRIIAVVNTELIMLSELRAEIAGEHKRIYDEYRGEELQRRLRQVEYMGLTRMIERKLQLQVAKAKGVDITDDEVDRAMRELQRQGEKVDVANPDDKRNIRDQLTLMRVVDREVRSGVMVSEPEIRRYYETHQNRFLMPDEYRISQIFILRRASDTPDATKARAAAVSMALKSRGDFTELALKHSDGPESTKGGNLGYVRQGELLPPIERALASLQPGDVSDPVETAEGWHMIRLDEKRPAQYRPYAEVKNEIQTLVYQQKSEDVYQTWLADLKNKSFIEVKF